MDSPVTDPLSGQSGKDGTLPELDVRSMFLDMIGARQLELWYLAQASAAMLADIRGQLEEYKEGQEREAHSLSKEALAQGNGEGDRAGKTLAHMLRKPWSSDYIVETPVEHSHELIGSEVVGGDD
ncbi:hypothetical protein NDU88_002296 [Pleurodeles waltl]|uniref:Uncharacterized protein n=1 Tax=Pleurodeles waltl TaxID=8319 RepID=A0AAV7PAF1_PLEWA|nr:hypothetical protein NDU88_002296 [Pleurodeles waltl]